MVRPSTSLEDEGESSWHKGNTSSSELVEGRAGGHATDRHPKHSIPSGPLSAGDTYGDVRINIEGIDGADHNDRLVGNAEANGLYGEVGNDTLTGGAGSDIFGFNTFVDNSDVGLITEFQVGVGGDTLRVGNILGGYSSGDDINDFLRIALDGGQTNCRSTTTARRMAATSSIWPILNGISSGVSVDTLSATGQIDRSWSSNSSARRSLVSAGTPTRAITAEAWAC